MGTETRKALCLCAYVVFFFLSSRTSAEQQIPRWELGPSVSTIRVEEFSTSRAWGFGGRGVLNFTKSFAADVQFARNTTDQPFLPSTTLIHNQFTANFKATWRPENAIKANPFGLAGAGLARDGASFGGSFPGSFYENR